jgi:hypothetical protein
MTASSADLEREARRDAEDREKGRIRSVNMTALRKQKERRRLEEAKRKRSAKTQ